ETRGGVHPGRGIPVSDDTRAGQFDSNRGSRTHLAPRIPTRAASSTASCREIACAGASPGGSPGLKRSNAACARHHQVLFRQVIEPLGTIRAHIVVFPPPVWRGKDY